MTHLLTVPPWILLRQERDGGTVFNTRSNKLYRVDSELYAVLAFCQYGVEQEKLTALVKKYGNAITDHQFACLLTRLLNLGLIVENSSCKAPMDCQPVESLFQELCNSTTIRDRRSVLGPVLVYLETTHRCNLACRHCYNNSGSDRREELDQETIIRLFEELISLGTFYVSITGGEPLVRTDILSLISSAQKRGLRVILSTNGTLVDETVANGLLEAGLSQVQVSLDSADAYLHDEFRGKQNAFQCATNAVRLLSQRKVPVTVCTTVTKENHKSIAQIVELAVNCGATHFRVMNLMPVGRGKEAYATLALTLTERETVEDELRSLQRRYRDTIAILGPIEDTRNPSSAICGAGITSCKISASGDVAPCSFTAWSSVGNINKQSFSEIWEHSASLIAFRQRLGQAKIKVSDCKSCHDQLLPHHRMCDSD